MFKTLMTTLVGAFLVSAPVYAQTTRSVVELVQGATIEVPECQTINSVMQAANAAKAQLNDEFEVITLDGIPLANFMTRLKAAIPQIPADFNPSYAIIGKGDIGSLIVFFTDDTGEHCARSSLRLPSNVLDVLIREASNG